MEVWQTITGHWFELIQTLFLLANSWLAIHVIRLDQKERRISNLLAIHERLFVKMLVLHLDTVRRAIEAGVFVKLQGVEKDVRRFFALPIPKAVWEQLKEWQDKDFVNFVETLIQ